MSDQQKIPEYSADYRAARPKNEPAAEKKAEPRAQPEPKQVPPAAPDRMDNDTEIDDFLPDMDRGGSEELLRKWSDGTADAAAAAPPRSLRKSGKYRWGLAAGAAVLLLALVGVVLIAVQAGKSIHAAVTDDSRLRAYDSFLSVVVAQDPKPFSSPENADADFVLNASLWKTMADNGSAYTNYDDAGRTVVPLGDVVDSCARLFGPKCALHPKNPDTESFYTYDGAKAQFHVSVYSLEGVYEPYTESAKKEGDSVVLRVGYVSPSDPARTASSGSSSAAGPSPVKTMEYVLKTNPDTGESYVYAVRTAS